MLTFEESLDRDVTWAFEEADRYFGGSGLVFQALRELAPRLDRAAIDYAVIGALAMFFHGYRRFTEDIDILISHEGMEQVNAELLGRGYSRPSNWSRGLRDVETGVAIHVYVAGTPARNPNYRLMMLPNPEAVSIEDAGLKIADMPFLLELKIMADGPCHRRHLADAQAMIQALDLPL